MKHTICFGDSITRGENDSEYGGWVDRLKIHCVQEFVKNQNDEVCTFNMGIGGEDTDGLMKRFKSEFDARLIDDGDNIVTIGYGANDLSILNHENLVPIERYISNLTACIDHALHKSAKVYLINIVPFTKIENLHIPMRERKMSDALKYNQALKLLAKEKQVEYIDVHAVFTNHQGNLFSFDGVHPNAKGHQLMFDKIREVIF